MLAAVGLVIRRREGMVGHTRQHNYYLTAAGRSVAGGMVADVPELRWYVDRVALLLRLVEGIGPTVLRDMQYEQPEYASAAWRSHIGSIAPRVRERLVELERGAQP